MNHCIYCLEKIEKQHSREHVIPACLGGEICLPDGYVCDRCNSYFAKMDKMFLSNNYIANTVLTQEIPNRKGKIRYELSDRWTYLGNQQFAFTLKPVSLLNKKSVTIKISQSKEFDELLFARAIHKVAFNCYAYKYGNDARKSCYNKIRNYIKKAKKEELWTYVVCPEPHLELACFFVKTKWGLLARIRILCLDFVVSFEGWRPEFEKLIRKHAEIFTIREVGQWQASTFLGLRHN